MSAEELQLVARSKNTATAFALEVENRLYKTDPEEDGLLPMQQRHRTAQKTAYIKAVNSYPRC